MNTRDRIRRMRELLHAKDSAGQQALIEEARLAGDRLFVSLAELQQALIPAIVQVWKEHGLLLDE